MRNPAVRTAANLADVAQLVGAALKNVEVEQLTVEHVRNRTHEYEVRVELADHNAYTAAMETLNLVDVPVGGWDGATAAHGELNPHIRVCLFAPPPTRPLDQMPFSPPRISMGGC